MPLVLWIPSIPYCKHTHGIWTRKAQPVCTNSTNRRGLCSLSKTQPVKKNYLRLIWNAINRSLFRSFQLQCVTLFSRCYMSWFLPLYHATERFYKWVVKEVSTRPASRIFLTYSKCMQSERPDWKLIIPLLNMSLSVTYSLHSHF